jgi:hypothetical protein
VTTEKAAYEAFDHRTRRVGRYDGPLSYFATDPCNGLGERLPRLRTLLIGPWKVSLTRRRDRTTQKPDPKPSDAGSVLVSLLLAVCIVGGLLGLLLLGQAAMCATHTTPGDRPVYCEPTTEGGER